MVFNVNGELHVFGLEKSPLFPTIDSLQDFVGFEDVTIFCQNE